MGKIESDLQLWSIVYVSTATRLMSDDELEELLEITHSNNALNNITGMLLYQDGNFMQLIEGRKASVDELYKKIKIDSRHQGIITLLEQPTDERLFSEWTMSFRNLRNLSLEDVKAASPYLEESLRSENYVNNPSRSLCLLKSFLESIR